MKRKLALLLAAALTVSAVSFNTYAEEYPEVKLVIDGEEVESDQPAVIVESRTMVPVRVIAEALGCEVDWDETTKTVLFTKDGAEASLTIGEAELKASANGLEVSIEIDAPATIINSRTMVPVRFISEYFGAEVDWDGEEKVVTITSGAVLVEDEATSDEAVEAEETDAEEAEETETEEVSEDAEDAEDAEGTDEEAEESEEEAEEAADEEAADDAETEEAAEAETEAEA